MSSVSFLTTGADAVRLITALGCMLLVGVNLAFIRHAKNLFARETYGMWRLFFAGKSLMTMYAGLSIWTRVQAHQPLSWRTPLVFSGLACSNVAIWRLHQLRALAHTRPVEKGVRKEADTG